MYERPALVGTQTVALEEHEAWWTVPLAIAALWGGSWAWCKAMCLGNGGVKSCKNSWWRVSVTCKG